MIPPSPKTVEIGGVKWREHYACYTTKLGNILPMSFTYAKGEYTVTVNGKEIGVALTPQHAASIAVTEARRVHKMLGARLAQIPEVKP